MARPASNDNFAIAEQVFDDVASLGNREAIMIFAAGRGTYARPFCDEVECLLKSSQYERADGHIL